MADFGTFNGPIKATFAALTQVTTNGSNTDVTITNPAEVGVDEGAKYITCIITTTGATLIELNGSATASSFPLTASDTLVAAVPAGNVIGVWGDGGTPTVTIKRVIT